MKRYLFPSILTIALTLLSVWLVSYSFDQRRLLFVEDNHIEDIGAFSRFPKALYESGLEAWQDLDGAVAARLFQQAVARDPLYMDAWLKLAEAEIEAGNDDLARRIVVFCHTKISQVLRWKRSQTLLAHDLDLPGIFRHNLNYLVDRKKWLPDIFFLLDTHSKFITDHALALLSTDNRPIYLEWLISWGRAEAARAVWEAIEAEGTATHELLIEYVHFLVSKKDVTTAAALWQPYSGIDGMTNAGFEKEITQKGFDWQIPGRKAEKGWQWRRVYGQSRKGAHSLRISFLGNENMACVFLQQVVPVTPGQRYQLSYWWKSKAITTDQGPFVDICSYDTKGLELKGSKALGSRDWVQASLNFTTPENCHAVAVQLRRNESLRFDSQIRGVLWLDNFALTLKKPEESQSGLAERRQ